MSEIQWPFLVFVFGALLAIVSGAIQIGLLKSQIIINTSRLGKIEDFLDEIRGHISNTNARWPDIERRLERVESIVNHITIDLTKLKRIED